MKQKVVEVRRIAIVLEDGIHVDGVLLAVQKSISKGLKPQLLVREYVVHAVLWIRPDTQHRIGKRVRLLRGRDLKRLPTVVCRYPLDFHSSPSFRSCSIR